jgi:hypothetical protein
MTKSFGEVEVLKTVPVGVPFPPSGFGMLTVSGTFRSAVL